MGRYFSQSVIRKDEIMVSSSALRFLGINPDNKEKIQIHFSLQMLERMFQALSDSGASDNLFKQMETRLGRKVVDNFVNG